jgi:hypothetical protein
LNRSYIETHHGPQGWIAYYSAAWRTGREIVADGRGNALTFTSRLAAENAAYRAMYEAENRIYALRLDPAQITRSPKFWETVRSPKSRAGRKALFNSIFRKAGEA